jgi:hypothetical protein
VDARAGSLAGRDRTPAVGEAEETIVVGFGHVVKCVQL